MYIPWLLLGLALSLAHAMDRPPKYELKYELHYKKEIFNQRCQAIKQKISKIIAKGSFNKRCFVHRPDNFLTSTEFPLHICASYNALAPELQKLLDKNADFAIRDNQRNLALHYAAIDGAHRNLALLINDLKHKVSPFVSVLLNMGNDNLQTPLHMAADSMHIGRISCIKALLAHGADVNQEDALGDRPLHYAVANDVPFYATKQVILHLLVNGAVMTATNKQNQTALDRVEMLMKQEEIAMSTWKGYRDLFWLLVNWPKCHAIITLQCEGERQGFIGLLPPELAVELCNFLVQDKIPNPVTS